MITANKPNRLINEKSPYLLQHAFNPVDWYPWGEEAFNKAKEEDKPIFLSIGYSTCHWCHVMEKESFEDNEVAKLLNEKYISIKVDREERPDIDTVYMNVCQMLTGSGGWPMTIIMTSEKKPFFAGTYFPKKTKYGRYGLIDILLTISSNWITDKESIIETGNEISNAVLDDADSKYVETEMSVDLFHKAKNTFTKNFDKKYGGFGSAPKFPTPHNLMFLLRYSLVEQDNTSMQMVEITLESMYRGGIFDHIAGGFSRYSTDNKWLIPHFEKMLYDNALLLLAYLEAYQITKKEIYKGIVIKTIKYIAQEMTDSKGGFYSAQDADSEGVEGKYYVFTPEEIKSVLGNEEGTQFNIDFDITKEGNFEENSVPNLINNNEYNLFVDEQSSTGIKYSIMFNKLYEYRKKRTKLHLDDKILTSWNALMISAIATAYLILGSSEYLTLAENAANFLCNSLTDNKGNLYVHYREGKSTGSGYLEDYAFTAWAMINMYKATFDVKWLSKALMYTKNMIDNFYDKENSGFYLYSEQSEKLFLRPKETYDGALPSGNSVAGYVLTYLSKITAEIYWEDLSYKQSCFLAESSKNYPSAYSFAMMAGMLNVYPTTEIVVVSDSEFYYKDNLLKIFSENYLFNTICIVRTSINRDEIEKIAPYTKDYKAKNGKVTYYVCKNKTCSSPVFSTEEVLELL